MKARPEYKRLKKACDGFSIQQIKSMVRKQAETLIETKLQDSLFDNMKRGILKERKVKRVFSLAANIETKLRPTHPEIVVEKTIENGKPKIILYPEGKSE